MIMMAYLTLFNIKLKTVYLEGKGSGNVGRFLTAFEEHESLVFSSLLLSDLEDKVRRDASLFNRSRRFRSMSVSEVGRHDSDVLEV